MTAFDVERQGKALPRALASRVAKLHRNAIVDGFLPSLGEPFLATLYGGLVRSDSAFLITACRGTELLGFICGAVDTRRAYRDFALSREAPKAALRLLPKVISLKTLRRVGETLLYPSKQTSVELPRAEILNFCVSAAYRGQGVGKQLFTALVGEFEQRQVETIRIVTGAEQRSAQSFYDRVGATRVTELEVHEGTSSVVYTFPIPSRNPHHHA